MNLFMIPQPSVICIVPSVPLLCSSPGTWSPTSQKKTLALPSSPPFIQEAVFFKRSFSIEGDHGIQCQRNGTIHFLWNNLTKKKEIKSRDSWASHSLPISVQPNGAWPQVGRCYGGTFALFKLWQTSFSFPVCNFTCELLNLPWQIFVEVGVRGWRAPDTQSGMVHPA